MFRNFKKLIMTLVVYLMLCALGGIALAVVILVLSKSFFFPTSGNLYNVVRGNKIKRVICAVDGWHVNETHNKYFDDRYEVFDILPNKWGSPENFHKHLDSFPNDLVDRDPYIENKSFLESTFNLYYIGIWPLDRITEQDITTWSIKTRSSGEPSPTDGKQVWKSSNGNTMLIENKRRSIAIPFRFSHAVLVQNAETGSGDKDTVYGGNIPLDLIFKTMAQTINSVKMYYRTPDWISQFMASCKAIVRDIVGSKSYEQIKSSQNELGTDGSFIHEMKKINMNVGSNNSIIQLFGFGLLSANLEDIDISGENAKKLIEASTLVEIAEQTKEAEKITAEGKARAYKIITDGKAAADRNYKIKTGHLDKKGVLQPDANMKVFAEAIQGHSGTLVFGKDVMPTITLDNKQENKQEEN